MTKSTKTVTPVRQLLNSNGQQVCENETETCQHYTFQYGNPGCDYCDRGIIDKNPHRLCPAVREGTK